MLATELPLVSPTIKRPFLDESADSFRAWLTERNQPAMRWKQIRKQILFNRAESFDDMTDLPKRLRQELSETFTVFSTTVHKHLTASDDTHKLLLTLADGGEIECVLIQEPSRKLDDGQMTTARATACISTQVGCGMGCVFCASGLNGVERNLTIGEMVEQLVRLRNLTAKPVKTVKSNKPPAKPVKVAEDNDDDQDDQDDDEIAYESVKSTTKPVKTDAAETADGLPTRLTHIVVMGMGEPLANLDNLLAALAIAGDKDGLGIGARHVTISTVGLPAKMRKLAQSGKQYHLAVSLHAPNNALRSKIVPTNEKTGIQAILSAADDFYETTGRQVTYEYVVLGKLNDQPDHAKQLANLLRGRKAHVNLIPWNDVTGLTYRRPHDDDLNALIETLQRSGISVKVRKRKGSEIDAACGQLRRETQAVDPKVRSERAANLGDPFAG